MHSAVYVQSAVCVSSVPLMMGNTVQCDVCCESQYDGDDLLWQSDRRPQTRFVTETLNIWVWQTEREETSVSGGAAEFSRL